MNESELHILVIDDDEPMRTLLADIVLRRGHQVVAVPSAEKGLELLPHWTFQIAFLDHNLPGMDGIVLGEFLRRNNPDMTIAMITGTDDPRVEKRSKDLALTFIAKPFDVAEIYKVIDDYAEAARERDESRKSQGEPDFGPPFAHYQGELTPAYRIPNVPGRVEDRLIETLKRSLGNLRTTGRYTERDRVIALSGLITARVLGIDLPKAPSGVSLFEEYDRIMKERGRRTEFEPSRPSSRPPPREKE